MHGRRQPCIGSERRIAGTVGLAGVASRVTVGARVSICFGSSYSTLSGPPQIGLGGEEAEGEGGKASERRRRWRKEDYRAAVSVALVI